MDFASFREKMAYQPILLGVFALLASGALAWASSATSDSIAAAEAKDLITVQERTGRLLVVAFKPDNGAQVVAHAHPLLFVRVDAVAAPRRNVLHAHQ